MACQALTSDFRSEIMAGACMRFDFLNLKYPRFFGKHIQIAQIGARLPNQQFCVVR